MSKSAEIMTYLLEVGGQTLSRAEFQIIFSLEYGKKQRGFGNYSWANYLLGKIIKFIQFFLKLAHAKTKLKLGRLLKFQPKIRNMICKYP
jgi:hypothetical protein